MLEFQISAVTNFQMDLLFLGRGGHGAEGAGAGKEGPLRKEGATDTPALFAHSEWMPRVSECKTCLQ